MFSNRPKFFNKNIADLCYEIHRKFIKELTNKYRNISTASNVDKTKTSYCIHNTSLDDNSTPDDNTAKQIKNNVYFFQGTVFVLSFSTLAYFFYKHK
jgi:hypothetical protein